MLRRNISFVPSSVPARAAISTCSSREICYTLSLTRLTALLEHDLLTSLVGASVGTHEVMDDALVDFDLAILCGEDARAAADDEAHAALHDLEELVGRLVPVGPRRPGAASGQAEGAMRGGALVVVLDVEDAGATGDGHAVERRGLGEVVLVLLPWRRLRRGRGHGGCYCRLPS